MCNVVCRLAGWPVGELHLNPRWIEMNLHVNVLYGPMLPDKKF